MRTFFFAFILCLVFLSIINWSFASNDVGITEEIREAAVKEALEKFQATGLPVIIMAVNYKYLPVLLNAAVFLQRAEVLDSLLLFCTDDKAQHELEKYHGHCINLNMERMGTTDLWKIRLELLEELMTAGIDCIFSDADAFWLENMATHVLKQVTEENAGIVASRGSFPEKIGERWGATLCMGFIYFRSEPATVELTKRMRKLYEQTQDDQISINRALNLAKIQWRTKLTYTSSTSVEYGDVMLKKHPLVVALLPHNQVMRICPTEPPVIPRTVGVAHCYTQTKQGADKKEAASEYNLWVIKDRKHIERAKENQDIQTWNQFVPPSLSLSLSLSLSQSLFLSQSTSPIPLSRMHIYIYIY